MEKKATQGAAREGSEAPLPADRAFVVQLRAQADASADLFVGRVEHIASGAAVRFASTEALILFIKKALAPPVPSGAERSASTANGGKTA